MRTFFLFAISITLISVADAAPKWLILGDSITQQGGYVDYIETWYLVNKAEPPEIVSLGLSSETVSGLSEPDHPYPRPYLHDRLDKVLAATKPDVVVACYGMNCGIYHPFSEERFAAYQRGIRKLVTKVHEAGADIILLTPPPYAGRVKPKPPPGPGEPFGYKHPSLDYNDVLARYAAWILSLDGADGIRAIDLRPAMERFMEKIYIREPVHPNAFGHVLMAEAFLQGMGEATGSDVLETGVDPRANDAHWQKVFALVHEQRMAFDMALLNHLGHGNPGVIKRETLPLDEAKRRHAELSAELAKLLRAKAP